VVGAELGPREAQILANLPRPLVKAFGDAFVTTQARELSDLVKSCGDSSVVG
jgi:hypothetical protein